MANSDSSNSNILKHHVQQDLCTTRLPYRQGRKLTAVKVYSVVNESHHLLIFGVPSLNLRAELKALCSRYGALKSFAQSLHHNELCEQFTECYRVSYDRIQSARVAKRQMDAKNFYGGSLHVCYAPEYEELSETRAKMMQRRRDIAFRLRNNQEFIENRTKTLNMNNDNTLESIKDIGNTVKAVHRNNLIQENMKTNNLYDENEDILKVKSDFCSGKTVKMKFVYTKQYKPCYIEDGTSVRPQKKSLDSVDSVSESESILSRNIAENDLTSETCPDKTVKSRKRVHDNIKSVDSYKEFGNEVIKKIAPKDMNRIKFVVKKSDI